MTMRVVGCETCGTSFEVPQAYFDKILKNSRKRIKNKLDRFYCKSCMVDAHKKYRPKL